MKAAKRILRWALAVYIMVIALFVCLQAVDIYRDAYRPEMLTPYGTPVEQAYTREKIMDRMGNVLLLSAGYPVVLIAAFAFGKREDGATASEPEYTLMRMKKGRSDLPEGAVREEKYRKRLRILCAAGIIACMIPAAAYLLDGNHFSSWDLEPVVKDMLTHVLPWLTVCFVIACAGAVLHGRSAQREIEAMKASPAVKAANAEYRPGTGRTILRIALFAAAIAFIVIGAVKGETAGVIAKAIRICTECIGLG